MKETYIVKQLKVVYGFAYLHKDVIADQANKNVWIVSGVFVDRKLRGYGYGRILIDRITRDADKESATLILSADPNADSPLQHRALVGFYKRHGFKKVNGTMMRRTPK